MDGRGIVLTPANGGSLAAVGDVTIDSDSDASGAGDLILQTGNVERGRITAAGVGSGLLGPVPLALTGATAATRYVGGTTSGAPASGTFAVGDFVVDQTGIIIICTVAGTPGTWQRQGLPALTKIGDASPFLGAQLVDITYAVRGIDFGNNIWGVDGTTLRVSTTSGASWSANKGFPPNTTQGVNVGKVIRVGTNLICLAKDEVAVLWKVYTSPYSSDDTALVWTARLSLATGATGTIGTNMCTATGALAFVAEYGNPVGGPSIYKGTSTGTSWASVRAADATLTHIHAVMQDPYNLTNIYATCGDGIAKTILRSTDTGATWATYIVSAAWQGVQISFSPNWIWIAGDSARATVLVIDRATGTPYVASPNWHANMGVPAPAAGDQFNFNCFYGVVDPATEIYYCWANDSSGGGNRHGMFWLPRVGMPVELLHATAATANGEMFLLGASLYTGNWKRPRFTAVALT